MSEAAQRSDKLNVFISYSREDVDIADTLDVLLEASGFAPTLDRHGIHGAEDWKKKLGALIRDCDTVVFVLSPSSAASPICAWEVSHAVELGKRIIPVVIRALGDTPAPPQLAALNYIYYYREPKKPDSGVRSGIAELIKALKVDLAWMQQHTRLLQRAMEWDAGNRQPNRLLSGGDIADAKAWAARRPKDAPEPTPLHLDFIRESEAEATRQADEQRAQLERMAAAQAERAKALADAEAALQREAAERAQREQLQIEAADLARREAEQALRVARRTRMGLIAALVLAVAASGAGIFAWQQRQEAKQQAAEANHQKQVADAKTAEVSENLKREVRTTSLFRAEQSKRILQKEGDATKAMLVALEVLPDPTLKDDAERDRKIEPEAYEAFQVASALVNENHVLVGHDGPVWSAAFSPDGRRIVTTSDDTTARLWDGDGTPLATLQGHAGRVTSAAFSPDGRRIVTASDDNTARLWDGDGQPLATLQGHGGTVWSAAFSPDGRRIVTASDDKTARLWGGDGQPLATLQGHDGAVRNAAFSPDGRRIVTTSVDNTARLWDGDGKPLATLQGRAGRVTSAAFSPEGRRIVTTSSDITARLWDGDGQPLATLQGHGGLVMSAAFSPDGRRIVTTSVDKTARLGTATASRWRRCRATLAGSRARRFRPTAAASSPLRRTARRGCGTATANRWRRCRATAGRSGARRFRPTAAASSPPPTTTQRVCGT